MIGGACEYESGNNFNVSSPIQCTLLPSHSEPPAKRCKLYAGIPQPSDASRLSSSQGELMKDHRMGKHGIHVSLMWKGFAKFMTEMKARTAIPDKWYNQARKLMQIMSNKYEAESDRKTELGKGLNFLGGLECEYALSSGAKCDLALVMNGHVYFNVEVKSEGGKDPITQNNLYFLHSHCGDEGLDPMLLLSMVGSHCCQVFGAVFGCDNELLVDPLCDPISLLDVWDDPFDGESKVARLLHTLAAVLPLLADYYYYAAVNQLSDRVPYYKQDELKYVKPIGTRVWETKNEQNATVAVKFTRMYSTEVHEFLAQKNMAPKLFNVCEMECGWKVIEMEYIQGKTLHECQQSLSTTQKQNIRHRLISIVEDMATSNFVHGDLRRPNIMIRNEDISSLSPTPIIIDFDWAGTQGQAKYPSSLNTKVAWPVGATPRAVIMCDHDREMVENSL